MILIFPAGRVGKHIREAVDSNRDAVTLDDFEKPASLLVETGLAVQRTTDCKRTQNFAAMNLCRGRQKQLIIVFSLV